MPPLAVTPFEFRDEPDIFENYLWVLGVSDGEGKVILALFVLIQYQCDGRMDGQTGGHVYCSNTSACIACYAIALIKMNTKIGPK